MIRSTVTGILDTFFNAQSRISYRRLLVFTVGTALLCFGAIEGSEWCTLALVYVGSDSGAKAIMAFRRAG